MTVKKHPNSKIVTIFRKGSFINDAQKAGAAEFVAMSKKSIGSYWNSSSAATQGSGLEFYEQNILMPSLVDCESTDRNFRTKVAAYFSSIKTNVPYEKGRVLEIGLAVSNDEVISEKNIPLNLTDYIVYRHALGHPWVAATRAEGEGNMLKEYYIFDAQEAENATVKVNANKDKALELYLQVKRTPEKIDQLLTILMIDPRTITGVNANSLKLDRLKAIADKTPDVFVDAFEDKFFEEVYVIRTMINAGVCKLIGKHIVEVETGETLGHTMEEAVAWFKDKNNSEKLLIMKARMQEALSKPIAATAKAAR